LHTKDEIPETIAIPFKMLFNSY